MKTRTQAKRNQTMEEADDAFNRSQRFNQRVKKAAHDGHATEGATRSDNRVSWSLINGFCMSYSICAVEEGYKIKFIASLGLP